MKHLRSILSVFAIFCLLFASVPQANAQYWITDGEEDILLDRTDSSPNAPLHEEHVGDYGYWEGTIWVEVINDGQVNTAYETLVEWIPGSMDYIEE